MKILSIALFSGEIRLSVLDGTVNTPTLCDHKRLVVKEEKNISDLMDWLESTFINEINRVQPSKIVCKLNLGVDKKQSITQIMPLGVFSLVSKRKNIPFDIFTTRQFSPSKFGLPKQTDLYQECDKVFGVHKPYWDKKQKDSIIGGWMNL